MAGENSLPVQYYHDDQQVLTEILVAPTSTAVPLLYADRNLIIDSVVVGVLTGTGSETLTINKTSSGSFDGITVTPATIATGATILGGTTGTISVGTAAANTTTVVTTESGTATILDNTKNTIDAGNWVLAKFSATMSSATITIQIRFRSRPK